MNTLAIVGAGPKAAAIVARAAVLRDLGVGVPRILVFEADHPGAAWSGAGGYSNGYLTLCSPGEKDVGYPYAEASSGAGMRAVAPSLFGRFSWSAFQVATGRYSDWVDRGRGHPSHRTWAKYLAWVFEGAGAEVINAEVSSVTPQAGTWRVAYHSGSGGSDVSVDGVVLTGTGRPRTVTASPDIPDGRLLDAESFWRHAKPFIDEPDPLVVVAGDGGAAGAILAWLAGAFGEREGTVVSVSPMGTLFPRGDGYAERRWFSEAAEWRGLTVPHRRELIARTEAGVISERNKRLIDRSTAVDYRQGKVERVGWDGEDLQVEVVYDKVKSPPIRADLLVTAIGFDAWSLLDLVDSPGARRLQGASGTARRGEVELGILDDCSLPATHGFQPGLHVPILAGLANGPGFGNLGSLGLMARSVLLPYCR